MDVGDRPAFRADAVNTLDAVMDYADAAGGYVAGLLDIVTDAVARGDITERQAVFDLWPYVAVASAADKACESRWTMVRSDEDGSGRRDWLRTRYEWHDDVVKFSRAAQLASLVNPRWEVSHP